MLVGLAVRIRVLTSKAALRASSAACARPDKTFSAERKTYLHEVATLLDPDQSSRVRSNRKSAKMSKTPLPPAINRQHISGHLHIESVGADLMHKKNGSDGRVCLTEAGFWPTINHFSGQT